MSTPTFVRNILRLSTLIRLSVLKLKISITTKQIGLSISGTRIGSKEPLVCGTQLDKAKNTPKIDNFHTIWIVPNNILNKNDKIHRSSATEGQTNSNTCRVSELNKQNKSRDRLNVHAITSVPLAVGGRMPSNNGSITARSGGGSSSAGDSSHGGGSVVSEETKAIFLEKVRESNAACQQGNFSLAVSLYTEAIKLDTHNHILFSNRSAAYIKMGQFNKAYKDAIKAKELNPQWPKAYYREGVALQCLGKHAEALAAFACGLAQDPKSGQLLSGLVEAAIKSPFNGNLEPTFNQLKTMNLDSSPFIIISVIGQELLAQGSYTSAVQVLECALKIGTSSLKLRGSVFSALSSAYWALNSLDKAISYMQEDLVVAKQLGDTVGECRAHGNLGSAYFSKGNFKDALTSNRYQLVLAMKIKDNNAAASALTSLGHIYSAQNDYTNALSSHQQCVALMKTLGNELQEAREIGNVGAVYLALGDFDNAVRCHTEHLQIAKKLANKVEEARAYSNLGSSHHYKRNFEQAIVYHNNVLRLATELKDHSIEARAYAGLGHAARCMNDLAAAQTWHEKQLDMALKTRDKISEGRACSNLGIVYQLVGNHDSALKLHQAHLNICRQLNDRAGMGRAFGNIGNAYSAMGFYEQAIQYHKQELTISKEVNDRSSEASTLGNLAVAYQALNMADKALYHYHAHLNLARELKDSVGEACALCNIGNCHSSMGQFEAAVPFYENYLMLSQELNDIEGEAKACHFLGYGHYCLGNFKEAIRYYDQDLALARDLEDRASMGRAYCNLGLAHIALGNLENALECQKYFLAISQVSKDLPARFRAFSNMGEVLLKMDNLDEAVKVYQKQLALAKQINDKAFEASAYSSLGICHRLMKKFDKALGFHTQELSILQDTGDLAGEGRAHGNLGAVHMALGNNTLALRCFQEQLERAKELNDVLAEAQAHGNMGITKMNLCLIEEAIANFEAQLECLEAKTKESPQVTESMVKDRARALGSLGDCYDSLGDYTESVKFHERYLSLALRSGNSRDQNKAYRGLGLAHKNLGNLQEALVCFEKRLVISHDLEPLEGSSAYGELGDIHRLLSNYEQAVNCIQHRVSIARQHGAQHEEAGALRGLGEVYQSMGDHSTALKYHTQHLGLAQSMGDREGQIQAHLNLGCVYEEMKEHDTSKTYHEQGLSIATLVNDRVAKIKALGNLGRLEYLHGNLADSVVYLQQGLSIAEQLLRKEDEARIRHRLGLALWQNRDLEGARDQLDTASRLFENIRQDVKGSTEYKLSLYDLQTACYQSLQRILVLLNRHTEALIMAERSRNRALQDLVNESNQVRNRRLRSRAMNAMNTSQEQPKSIEDLEKQVNRQKASVLYYSLAAGYLYSWLIIPTRGVVKFHATKLSEDADNFEKPDSDREPNILENYIQSVRSSLGIDSVDVDHNGNDDDDDIESADQPERKSSNGVWSNHLEELGDKLNQESDRTGFLRMVNRSSRMNASSYSLSSLFSVGSLGDRASVKSGHGGANSRAGSTRSRRSGWQGHSSLRNLYQLLIEPMEDDLPEGCPCELILVLEGDLYLVPFPVLKGSHNSEYLCERFSLLVIPSLTNLKNRGPKPKQVSSKSAEHKTQALVIGNPKIPSSVTDHWGWHDIPHAEQEAKIVGEILQNKPFLGSHANKDNILSEISSAECVHFSCHVSWKLSAIVMSPGEFIESRSPSSERALSSRRFSVQNDTIHEEEDLKSDGTIELPALSEYLLTAADILKLKLSAKLVVLSSCYTRDKHGVATADGVIGLSRALLAAGAQCVLISLWPVPETAVKLIMKALYSSLLQGSRVSRALAEAMTAVQTTKYFQHPANWSGFMLVGQDIKLNNKVALMGQALREIISTPDTCRDALRVTLHLVEKSLQRINRGYKNAMYTSQKSIENKVGSVEGWKDLLMSVGFRFEPAANGIPAAVFFPQSDPGERLTQCSASLQAILALSANSWTALSSILSSPESADEIMALFRQVISEFGPRDLESESQKVGVNVKLWRVPGCHELLASLGFDLMEVGREDVMLKTSRNSNKRQIQFALQALIALFDTDEAPRSIDVDSCDSMEDDNIDPVSLADSSSPPPTIPPFPAPRKSDLVLEAGGAFSSYARNRGEPDGRQSQGDSPTGSISSAYQSNKPSLSTLLHNSVYHHQKGRESDCNFTPSPVDSMRGMARYSGNYSMNSSHDSSLYHSPGRYGYAKQLHNISSTSHLRPSPLSRPESVSSSGSLHEPWDTPNGQNTVLRRHQQPSKLSPGVTDPSSVAGIGAGFRKYLMASASKAPSSSAIYENAESLPYDMVSVRSIFTESGYQAEAAKSKLSLEHSSNDKLSIRAEGTRMQHLQFNKKDINPRLEPGVMTREPPTGESNSPKGSLTKQPKDKSDNIMLQKTDNNHGEHIMPPAPTSQMRNMPLTEVYHERSIGLAPPLSKLIMSNTIAVAQVEHHMPQNLDDSPIAVDNMSNFDNLSAIEDALPTVSRRMSRPAVAKKPDLKWQPNGHHGNAQRHSRVSSPPYMTPEGALLMNKNDIPLSSIPKRDEGDGRSMTDSQYSGYSPNAGQGGSANNLASPRFNFMKFKDGVPPVPSVRSITSSKPTASISPPSSITTSSPTPSNHHYMNMEYPAPPGSSKGGDSKHPHGIWTTDKNGRFTYKGNLASDC